MGGLFTFLSINVGFDSYLVDTNGGNEVASAPEGTIWNLLVLLFEPVAGLSLEEPNNVGNGMLGRNDKIKVNVFITNMPSFDFDVFPAADELEYSLHLGFNILRYQYLTSVLRGPNYVVLAKVSTML